MIEKLEASANTLAAKEWKISNLENSLKGLEIECAKKTEEIDEMRVEIKQ